MDDSIASIDFYLFVVEWIYTFGQAEIEEGGFQRRRALVAAAPFPVLEESEDRRPEMGGRSRREIPTCREL
jgi:hypothetical protein